MTKTAAFAIAVWGAGLTGAAALAYTLRPPAPMVLAEVRQGRTSLDVMGRTPPPTLVNQTVGSIELPPVFITSRVARPLVTLRTPSPSAVTELRCGDWRPLQQGTAAQQVRHCD